jgi:hypothetical protein
MLDIKRLGLYTLVNAFSHPENNLERQLRHDLIQPVDVRRAVHNQQTATETASARTLSLGFALFMRYSSVAPPPSARLVIW